MARRPPVAAQGHELQERWQDELALAASTQLSCDLVSPARQWALDAADRIADWPVIERYPPSSRAYCAREDAIAMTSSGGRE